MSARSLRSQSAITSGQPHRGDSHIDAPTVSSSASASHIINTALNTIADLENQGLEEKSADEQSTAEENHDAPSITAGQDNAAEAQETTEQKTSTDDKAASADPMERLASALASTILKISEKSNTVTVKASTDYNKGPEARVPDKYDGTRADKLRPFLSGLNIVFLNHDKRFATDRAKVLFAGSFLSGVAADWFEPIINESSKEALMLDNYDLFKDRITKVFGDPNAEATAEHNLRLLVMKDSEAIANYITRFRTESARLKWDDAALKYHFRTGLADRILDDLARMTDQPDTLSELMEMSLSIDNRHWERNREKSFRRPNAMREPTKTSPGSSTAFGLNPSRRDSQRNTSRSLSRPSSTPFVRNKDTRFKRTDSRTNVNNKSKDLERVLVGGRLTADEKQRRLDKGLCNYCGGPHKLDNCPAKPDGRAVTGRHLAVAGQPKN